MDNRLNSIIRSVYIILMSAILLLPAQTSLGLETMNNREMQDVSAQTGVGILIDHTYIYRQLDQRSIKDPEGLSNQENDAASLNINNFELDVLRIEALPHNGTAAIFGKDKLHSQWDHVFEVDHSDAVDDFPGKIMTIDFMDELPAMSRASNYANSGDPHAESANMAGVFIGLPTTEFFVNATSIGSVKMDAPQKDTLNADSSFGHFTAKALQADMLSGYMEIAPHEDTGVDIMLDDIILYFKFDNFYHYYTDNNEETNKCFRIEDWESDVIRINAITHLNSNGQPQSPGKDIQLEAGNSPNTCNTKQADNYDFQNGAWKDRPLSIDLSSKLPALSEMEDEGYIAGVHLGVPAMEIYQDYLDFDFTFGNSDHMIGKIELDGLEVATLEGSMEVAPHNGYGCDITVDDVVMYMSFDQFSYQDWAHDGELDINDFEMDMLHINSIALNDSGGMYSPGRHGLHMDHLDISAAPQDFEAQPISIDMSGELPTLSENAGGPMAGVSIGLPTLEFHADQIGIGSIALDDPDGTANNEGDPFFRNIRIQGATHTSLGGRAEIAPAAN